jgi:predicted nuclease with TOPRIM domain
MYLTCKQERDHYKGFCEKVRRDMESIDKIVKENVERAVRAKDKQIGDMMAKFKEKQEKMAEAEAHKQCFSNTIKSLESQMEEIRQELENERNANAMLKEKIVQGGVNPVNDGDEEFEPFDLEDNIDNIKRMQVPDANYLRKINEADNQFLRSSVDKASALRSSGVNPIPSAF